MNLETIRDQFPTTQRWTFLDHAAVAPLSLPCANAMREYLDDMSIHGVHSYGRWSHRIAEVRQLAAKLLGANVDDVAFIPNTSMGIGYVAEGYPWKPGDNVVIAAEEYPSNQYPWMNQASRGVEIRSVASRGNRLAMEDVFAATDAHTRVVALSSVEFASGFRNDLVRIGEHCRRNNIFFFVDAIQSLGVFPMDVAQLPIDALAADSHKWMLGPEGAGIFWIRREWVDRLHPISVGWNSVVRPMEFSTIDFTLKPHAGRWEGGAFNVAGIVGMGESLRLLLDVGIDNVQSRVTALTDRLCEGAARRGAVVFSSRVEGEKSGIVSLLPASGSPSLVKKRCLEAGIIVNVRAERLRVSPHFYNTFDEIDHCVELLG